MFGIATGDWIAIIAGCVLAAFLIWDHCTYKP